ncbi:MAG: glycosyltransferase family 4 protein [Syntrophaceae bacterium]|nr:glycosyltransferase family 4 protein [Syntrophaceae bacterium]
MNLGFALFNYFPYGGLERDMLTFARVCHERGHDITIYTGGWQGDKPEDIHIVELTLHTYSNHARANEFAARLQQKRNSKHDAMIGFNKMPGLDVYYAADVCFAAKAFEERNFFYRMTPRYRTYLALEKAVFGCNSKTQILMISKVQIELYQRYYQTPSERLHLLPPGINRERILPSNYNELRSKLRASYGLKDTDLLMLCVGSDFQRKGLDRALRGIAALPEPLRSRVKLWVAGQDKDKPFRSLARTLDIDAQVSFLGARDDIAQLLWAADALVHLAYSENTGTVLLEGMVAGLPVIATDVCGYAHYILDNKMGSVLGGTVTPNQVAQAMAHVLSEKNSVWHERSRLFTAKADIFSMPHHAADLIEQVAARNHTD